MIIKIETISQPVEVNLLLNIMAALKGSAWKTENILR
ncbi:hypothetical protein ROSI111154_24555 [Rouxiella silvae]